ncbi:MAG: potassium-transporting ATPase subunit KdpA, partial [Candidatus Firestonebacteria bacterium]|nr:potassium-transporting ATPase subunit KdpA [Candidatus Firestonebacteria bacterium]
MTSFDLTQLCIHFGSLLLLAPWLGIYMSRVFSGEKHWLAFLAPVEKNLYALSGINPSEEMTWPRYLAALLLFNALGIMMVLALQLTQAHLPLNPQKLPNVPFWLACNTAVSFVTNTNWQNYAGEKTLSYLTQMLGLTVQNFLSAATGLAVFLAFGRGLLRHETSTLGNFWTDVTRTTLYILLPLSVLWALLLGGQGVVQNFKPYVQARTLENAEQII